MSEANGEARGRTKWARHASLRQILFSTLLTQSKHVGSAVFFFQSEYVLVFLHFAHSKTKIQFGVERPQKLSLNQLSNL